MELGTQKSLKICFFIPATTHLRLSLIQISTSPHVTISEIAQGEHSIIGVPRPEFKGPTGFTAYKLHSYVTRSGIHKQCLFTFGELDQMWLSVAHPRMARQGEVIPFLGDITPKKARQMNRMSKQASS